MKHTPPQHPFFKVEKQGLRIGARLGQAIAQNPKEVESLLGLMKSSAIQALVSRLSKQALKVAISRSRTSTQFKTESRRAKALEEAHRTLKKMVLGSKESDTIQPQSR